MAQFDVHRVRGGGLAIDVQSDVLRDLPTRFVVPLRGRDASVMGRLTPVFSIEGQDLAMVTHLAGAIYVRDLDAKVTSLIDHEYEIKAALDMLLSGF